MEGESNKMILCHIQTIHFSPTRLRRASKSPQRRVVEPMEVDETFDIPAKPLTRTGTLVKVVDHSYIFV